MVIYYNGCSAQDRLFFLQPLDLSSSDMLANANEVGVTKDMEYDVAGSSR